MTNEEVKGQSIFLYIIGIATLLVAVLGATFAWFNYQLNNEEEAQGIIIKTASLSSITFEDGAAIDITDMFPGDSKSKNFTIAQTDPTASEEITYEIKLNIVSNTLSANANGAFVNSLVGKGNDNGGSIVDLKERPVEEKSYILGTGILKGYETHTYTYTLSLKELNIDQTDILDKEFSAYLSANLVNIKKDNDK